MTKEKEKTPEQKLQDASNELADTRKKLLKKILGFIPEITETELKLLHNAINSLKFENATALLFALTDFVQAATSAAIAAPAFTVSSIIEMINLYNKSSELGTKTSKIATEIAEKEARTFASQAPKKKTFSAGSCSVEAMTPNERGTNAIPGIA